MGSSSVLPRRLNLPQFDAGLQGSKRTAAQLASVGIDEPKICGLQFTRLILDFALWAETCKTTPLDIGTKQLNKRLSKIAPALLDKIAEKTDRVGGIRDGCRWRRSIISATHWTG